jgi:hypothetical protein
MLLIVFMNYSFMLLLFYITLFMYISFFIKFIGIRIHNFDVAFPSKELGMLHHFSVRKIPLFLLHSLH